MDLAISATPPTTSSNRLCCTNRREPATQHWPWLTKIALAAPSTAPGSASSNTMLGRLPPSSSETFFRFPAAWTISFPTSLEPVKVEQVGGQRDVSRLRDHERLAVVERFQLGELVGVRQDQVADPPDDPPSLGRRHPAPRAFLERPAGRPHRPVDVLGVSLGDIGEDVASGRLGSG
jgi:hypothetical protein